MDKEKTQRSTTTDGKPPRPGLENAGAPAPAKKNGQHEAYWILTEEERAKGFVRPVRRCYIHKGIRPKHPTRELTPAEKEKNIKFGYVVFEAYPESESPRTGRYWTKEQLEGGCGVETTMSPPIAETYARDPKYYGSTFCCGCQKHLPVEEFVWIEKGQETNIKMGE